MARQLPQEPVKSLTEYWPSDGKSGLSMFSRRFRTASGLRYPEAERATTGQILPDGVAFTDSPEWIVGDSYKGMSALAR
jgi:hypothetical protein